MPLPLDFSPSVSPLFTLGPLFFPHRMTPAKLDRVSLPLAPLSVLWLALTRAILPLPQFTVPVTRQARPRRPRPRFLPSAPASGLLWIASPIRRYYYCGLRRRGLLWIASSIRRFVDIITVDCCGLRRRGLLWIASSIRRYGLDVVVSCS